MMISVCGLTCLTLRMKASVLCTSPTGSGGLPSTKENSGTMPCASQRSAQARICRVGTGFDIRASTASLPLSAPKNIICRPLRRKRTQVSSP